MGEVRQEHLEDPERLALVSVITTQVEGALEKVQHVVPVAVPRGILSGVVAGTITNLERLGWVPPDQTKKDRKEINGEDI
jgi:hypothetical protein